MDAELLNERCKQLAR